MSSTLGKTIKRFSGAAATRVVDRAGGRISAHSHEWPVLSLYRLGSYVNETECGTQLIGSPSAVLYRAGTAHANQAGSDGFEQIEIEFDPDWLGVSLPDDPVVHIRSGELVHGVHRLASAWEAAADDKLLRVLTSSFVSQLRTASCDHRPRWILETEEALRQDPGASVCSLAASTGRTAAWVGAEYMRWTGETIRQASARLRVAQAAVLLRETVESPASIACAAGFCDQSHMIRNFRRVLGRTPQQVREDRPLLRTSSYEKADS